MVERDPCDVFLSIANVIIVCSLVSLTILDSLADAPPIPEIVRNELSRIFTLKGVQREFPEYKDIIDADLAREILAEPFRASTPTKAVVDTLTQRICAHPTFRVDSFLQTIFTEGIGTDPVVYAILRRGLNMMTDPDTIVTLIDQMNGEFGITSSENMHVVIDMYRSVYQQIM